MGTIPDIAPAEAWAAIQQDLAATRINVRADAGWNVVGCPDIAAAGKRVVLIPWLVDHSMAVNGHFTAQMQKAGVAPDHRVYFIGRSGARSLAAAQVEGYSPDVDVGFQGSVVREDHRGVTSGWKAAGPPWLQR
jgi:rhodanese-related sulfurtransferase